MTQNSPDITPLKPELDPPSERPGSPYPDPAGKPYDPGDPGDPDQPNMPKPAIREPEVKPPTMLA